MKVLFVCTGNTCRSPLAQAVLQEKIDKENIENIQTDSAGVYCGFGEPMSANTQAIIDKMGIFFTHSSQPVTQKLIDESDIIITMTKGHKELLKAYVSPQKLYCVDDITHKGDILDPYGGDMSVYEKVYNQLKECMPDIINLIDNMQKAQDKSSSEDNGEK